MFRVKLDLCNTVDEGRPQCRPQCAHAKRRVHLLQSVLQRATKGLQKTVKETEQQWRKMKKEMSSKTDDLGCSQTEYQ